MEFPLGEIFMKKAMTSADPGPHGNPSTAVAVAANVAASAVEAAYEEGLARLKARAFERLELDERLEKLSEEVNRREYHLHFRGKKRYIYEKINFYNSAQRL